MTEPMKKVSPLRGEGREVSSGGLHAVTDNDANIDRHINRVISPKGKIGGLSIYRMQLLGTEGMRRYRETGYIPDELID